MTQAEIAEVTERLASAIANASTATAALLLVATEAYEILREMAPPLIPRGAVADGDMPHVKELEDDFAREAAEEDAQHGLGIGHY